MTDQEILAAFIVIIDGWIRELREEHPNAEAQPKIS